jgi:hypothetical protein
MALSMTLDLERPIDNFISWPSSRNAFVDNPNRKANRVRPISGAHGNPAIGEHLISPRVARLLGWGGPPAIVLVISKAVIPSVKTCAFRWFAHIIQKLGEVLPFGANKNSTGSIVPELRMARICAPGAHVSPGCVGAGSAHPVYHPMLYCAPARLAIPAREGRGFNIFDRSASAFASVHSALSFIERESLKHRPFTKNLPGQISG